jgi:hypothetical protein
VICDGDIGGIQCCNDTDFDSGIFLMQPEKPAKHFFKDVTMYNGVCIIQADKYDISGLGAFFAQGFNESMGGDAVQGCFLVEHGLKYRMKYPEFGLYYPAVDEHGDDM